MKLGIPSRGACSLALLAAFVSLPAQALTIASFDQGSVSRSSSIVGTSVSHDPNSAAMSVFSLSVATTSVTQNAYALFEIPLSVDPSAGAELMFDVGNASPFAATIFLSQVTTPAAVFQMAFSGNSAEGLALHADLGGGDYGSAPVPAGNTTVSFVLPAAALADLGAAAGGVFAIGFTGTGAFGAPIELFSPTLSVSVVPELGPAWMMSLGLLVLGTLPCRRRDGAQGRRDVVASGAAL